MRFLSKLLFTALFAGAAVRGQDPGAAVVPPSNASLDGVNLKTEWTTAVPLTGRQDGVGLIQVADGNQVFIQTRTGLLVALDAKTGSQQWQLKYTAAGGPIREVAVNDRYVVATNLTTLYLLYRYSGLVEFQYTLPLVPSAGPAIDADMIYVTLNGQRVTAYGLPASITTAARPARS